MALIRHTVSMISLLALLGCGGGGSGGGTSSGSSFQQSYTASAAVGEVLNYTFNSSNRSYAYTITKSAYNLANVSATAPLLANTDGTYSPSAFPTAKLYAVQGSVIGGAFPLPLQSGAVNVPFFGIASPATTPSAIAGTYNFVSIKCQSPSSGGFTVGNCGTEYGTMEISASNPPSYRFCGRSNLTTGLGGCTPQLSGQINHTGSGIWQLTNSSFSNIDVFFIGMKGSNNQRIGVLDFNNAASGFGHGQAVLAEQQATSMAEVSGSYVFFKQDGTAGAMDLMSNGTASGSRIFNANALWTGMATSNASTGDGYALFSGSGFYIYRDPSVSDFSFEIGIKK